MNWVVFLVIWVSFSCLRLVGRLWLLVFIIWRLVLS